MKKALLLLILSAIVGVGMRYAFPRELVFTEEGKQHVDELLDETLSVLDEGTDTLPVLTEESPKDSVVIARAEAPIVVEEAPIEQGVESNGYLDTFFRKLHQLQRKKKGQIRIAFFGDSMLDADMLVMQFRHYLQHRFGGRGVGFVPITSVSASGRYSVKHSFSYNWKKQSFLKRRDTIFPFGINGETFFVGDSIAPQTATVTFRKGGAYRELDLVSPKLYYGKRRMYDSITVEEPSVVLKLKEEDSIITLDNDNLLNSVALPSGLAKLKLEITDQGSLPFYGVSFASESGIIVDNLAIRGNSGMTLTRLKKGLMQQFHKAFDYDLVILSYGTNVFNPKYSNKGYAWYARRMQRVVTHLRKCFKGADVIVTSMADRAVKIEEEMQTPPELHAFIVEQKNIADHTQSAFFSLYDAMGGAGSMKQWVEASPSLANKDYTHFNSRGAEKAARFLYEWLIQQYEDYVQVQEQLEQKAKEEAERKRKADSLAKSKAMTETIAQ